MDPKRRTFLESQLSAYMDGELSPRERAEIDAFLASDMGARNLLKELQATAEAVSQLPRARASDDLMDGIRSRLERRALLSEPTPAEESRSPLRFVRWVSMAAGVALLVTGSYLLWPELREPASPPVHERFAMENGRDEKQDVLRDALADRDGDSIEDARRQSGIEGERDEGIAHRLNEARTAGKLDSTAAAQQETAAGRRFGVFKGGQQKEQVAEAPAAAPSFSAGATIATAAPPTDLDSLYADAMAPTMGDPANRVVFDLSYQDSASRDRAWNDIANYELHAPDLASTQKPEAEKAFGIRAFGRAGGVGGSYGLGQAAGQEHDARELTLTVTDADEAIETARAFESQTGAVGMRQVPASQPVESGDQYTRAGARGRHYFDWKDSSTASHLGFGAESKGTRRGVIASLPAAEAAGVPERTHRADAPADVEGRANRAVSVPPTTQPATSSAPAEQSNRIRLVFEISPPPPAVEPASAPTSQP